MITIFSPTCPILAAINAVNLDTVPVMATDRHIPRKQQAALARKLFRELGLTGIRVRTPNYSMASTVDVTIPKKTITPQDYLFEGVYYVNHSFADMPAGVPAKIINGQHYVARQRLEQILGLAFPNHDNRSDYQTDYFDSCWSIN